MPTACPSFTVSTPSSPAAPPARARWRHALRVTAPMALAAVLAAGCAMPMSPGGKTTALTARLGGADEVPPNRSSGTGSLEARYDAGTQMLRWKVTYAGLTGPVTGAHFHGPADPGTNTGVVVPFAPPLTSPIEGEAKLSAVQATDLLAGRWYVNLHTAAHPAGEIRGQLLAAP
mgnify:CR=1 FL=1